MLHTTPSVLIVSRLWRANEGANEMTETEFKNAAWYYPAPKDKAKNIKDYVAFCKHISFLFDWCLCFGILHLF
jgi:hypothetical protein